MNDLMSAIGTKRTSACALHMSPFGGKAYIPFCAAHVRSITQSGHLGRENIKRVTTLHDSDHGPMALKRRLNQTGRSKP